MEDNRETSVKRSFSEEEELIVYKMQDNTVRLSGPVLYNDSMEFNILINSPRPSNRFRISVLILVIQFGGTGAETNFDRFGIYSILLHTPGIWSSNDRASMSQSIKCPSRCEV